MSAVIGGIAFDYYEGFVQPPGKKVVIDGGASGGGDMRNENDRVGGRIIARKFVADAAAATTIVRSVGLLKTQAVTVTLDGYTFADIYACTGVEVVSRRARGARTAGQEWLVEATFDLGDFPDAGEKVADLFLESRIYVAPAIADLDANQQPALRCATDVEGYGVQLGGAVLVQDITADQALLDLVGQYVRIDVPDDIEAPTTWVEGWLGKIVETSVEHSGAAGIAYGMHAAIQIGGALKSSPGRWYERQDDDTVVDPGHWLAVNGIPNGDRSQSLFSGVYVHDRSAQGFLWRARMFLETTLAKMGDFFASDITWELGGQYSDALGNFDRAALDGGTVLDLAARLCASGIGCVWDFDTSAATVTLSFYSPLQASITVDDYTIPASTRQITVDLTAADIPQRSVKYHEDHREVYDEIRARASAGYHCASFGIALDESEQFDRGYDASLEDSFDNAATDEEREDPRLHLVYRRFVLKPSWEGETFTHLGNWLDTERVSSAAADPEHGDGGETGEFTGNGVPNDGNFAWASVKLEKYLPINAGVDVADIGSSGSEFDERAPLMEPKLFRVTDPHGPDESWTALDLDIEVDSENNAIVLGRSHSDGETLRDLFAAGDKVVATLGWRFPKPWRMSWRRLAAEIPCAQERHIEHHFPDLEYHYIEEDTVFSADATGAPDKSPAGLVGGAKPSGLVQRLALLRLRHQHPQVSVTWEQEELLDLGTAHRPGALITEATLPWSIGAKTLPGAGAVITTRTRYYDRDRPRTAYAATTLAADIPPTVIHASKKAPDLIEIIRRGVYQP